MAESSGNGSTNSEVEEKPVPKIVSSGKKTKKRSKQNIATSKSRRIAPSRGESSVDGEDSKRKPRPYPLKTIDEALVIAQNIKKINNGNPWATEEVAKSCNVSAKGTIFFYLAAASRDFGLTIGSRSTDKIELGELGREIVFADDPAKERENKIRAFFSIDIFKRVFDHYGSGKLPAQREYVKNTLHKSFGLDPEFHEEFIDLFERNCAYLGLQEGHKGAKPPTEVPADETGEIRVVGEPKGKFDRTAFVIMPFVEKGESPRPKGFFGEVLRRLVTPAGNSAGFAVVTAERKGSDVIQSTIINQLMQAELIIADLTDHNPNVLFELGIRIAKELPVALIKAEGTGHIFDVDNMMRVLPYDPNLWVSSVENDRPLLTDHIKAAWDNRTTYRSYMEILTGNKMSLAPK
jgi:hypothetical protein